VAFICPLKVDPLDLTLPLNTGERAWTVSDLKICLSSLPEGVRMHEIQRTFFTTRDVPNAFTHVMDQVCYDIMCLSKGEENDDFGTIPTPDSKHKMRTFFA